MREFIYKDIDYLLTPDGWLAAKLQNRYDEGYEIWRDEKELAWRGKLTKSLNPFLSEVKIYDR